MRPIPAAALRHSLVWRVAGRSCVRERPSRYEDDGTVREARGAVPVGGDAWWTAAITVPLDVAAEGDAPLRLRLVRHGATPLAPVGAPDVELMLPAGELSAVVALLAGIAAQAERDGLLPAAAP